ncbi:hypothetical protein [Amycolatopsis sp. lyj-108]|uniref:hypothetical protein n=1 Tax=Amycolatopsis sp. lyj-108 TaxID=2789286 RepID=UPI00397AD8C0
MDEGLNHKAHWHKPGTAVQLTAYGARNSSETLRQLDEMRERTDQLIAHITDNLNLVRRVTNRR